MNKPNVVIFVLLQVTMVFALNGCTTFVPYSSDANEPSCYDVSSGKVVASQETLEQKRGDGILSSLLAALSH